MQCRINSNNYCRYSNKPQVLTARLRRRDLEKPIQGIISFYANCTNCKEIGDLKQSGVKFREQTLPNYLGIYMPRACNTIVCSAIIIFPLIILHDLFRLLRLHTFLVSFKWKHKTTGVCPPLQTQLNSTRIFSFLFLLLFIPPPLHQPVSPLADIINLFFLKKKNPPFLSPPPIHYQVGAR